MVFGIEMRLMLSLVIGSWIMKPLAFLEEWTKIIQCCLIQMDGSLGISCRVKEKDVT